VKSANASPPSANAMTPNFRRPNAAAAPPGSDGTAEDIA